MKRLSKRGYVATSQPGQKRWKYGEMKQCDNCDVMAPWTEQYFYRRYGDKRAIANGYKNGDEMATALGYVPNLQPHCKDCTHKTFKERINNGTSVVSGKKQAKPSYQAELPIGKQLALAIGAGKVR